jgi:DNA modification methylase
MYRIYHDDCLEKMKDLKSDSVDAIVTDPPYGLSFMGEDWDHGIPGKHFWEEAIRVAKPGAYLLAFGGTRTYHRLACAIEDAGWEIRDCISWVYGQGFPKSLNISKAIDKMAGAEREVVGRSKRHVSGKPEQRTEGLTGSSTFAEKVGMEMYDTLPSTDAAKQWDGWGSALKPAYEPIVLARKPLSESTVVGNVLKYGTGGINIDGCRIEYKDEADKDSAKPQGRATSKEKGAIGASPDVGRNMDRIEFKVKQETGRFPSNFIHDGSEEVLELFPKSGNGNGKGAYSYKGREYDNKDTSMFNGDKPQAPSNYNDLGSAARFFYCAKASKSDRDSGNIHPTVKPTSLMQYLCRLITPPNGIILDPFMGSGSTGKAAILEGFSFIGIEKEKDYIVIAKKRLEAVQNEV